MKRFILSVAILATLASCSKNEIGEIVESTPNAIGFSALDGQVTKTPNTTYANYNVYAVSSSATASDWYINDIYNSSDVNVASNKYYWPASIEGADAATTVDFMAYAPVYGYRSSTNDADNWEPYTAAPVEDYTAKTITFTFQSLEGLTDLTVATPVNGLSSGTVSLAFNHLLSRATFDVEIGVGDTTATGYDATDANYNPSLKYKIANFNAASITTASGSTVDYPALSFDFEVARKYMQVVMDQNKAGTGGWTTSYVGEPAYFTFDGIQPQSSSATSYNAVNFVPQSIAYASETSAASFSTTIKINDICILDTDNNTVFFYGDLSYVLSADDITGGEFLPSRVYNMTLTIDYNSESVFGGLISFNSTVADWTALNYEDSEDVDVNVK